MSDFVILGLICITVLCGVFAGKDIYSAFVAGAKSGLKTAVSILPSVTAMMVAVNMLRASGALDFIITLFSPFINLLGIPAECAPLALLKPVSGGGALALGADIIKSCGVDSPAGQTAAVMLASADTTFFVVSVYFGSLGIKNLRHTIPAALCADAAAFIAAAAAVRIFM